MSRAARIRSILALAIILIGFALWSMSVIAQVPGGSAGPNPAGSSAVAAPATGVRDSGHAYLRAGDAAFAKTDFAAAELEYRRAAEREPSFRAYYNLGVALARQGRDAEAAEAFGRARGLAPADEVGANVDAAYNAGTAAATVDELERSVEAYVDALRADPHDREAKENLAHVLKQLRRQREEQQQQQQEGSEEGEDDEPTPEPGEGDSPPPDSEGGEQQAGEDEGQSPEPTQNERDAEEEQQQTDGAAAEPAEDVDRAEAERLLNLAGDLERETQERLKLGERTRARPEKDW